MNYLDFSNLLMLALGFNAVYVVRKSKLDNRPFFLWLDKISEFIEDANKKIDVATSKISNIKPRLEFFKQHTPMSEGEKLSKKEKQIISTKNIENKHKKLITIKKRCDFLERTRNINNLSKIALMSLFYSMYILISAVYEHKCNVALNDSLVIPNMLITIFAIICILSDWSCIKKYLNRALFAIFVTGVAVVLFGCAPFTIKYNHIYTIGVCFIGFILYFLATAIGYIFSDWYYQRASFIEKKIDEIEKVIEVNRKKDDSELEKEIMKINIFDLFTNAMKSKGALNSKNISFLEL